MKIIDMRARAPYGKFLEGGLYQAGYDILLNAYAKWYGVGVSNSVKTKKFEDLLAEMDELGIERIVTPVRPGEGHDQESNDCAIELQEKYAGRIIAVAGIDKLGGQSALDEIDRVKGKMLGGIILETAFGVPVFADDARIFPIYEKCQNENIPVMMTFGGRGYGELKYYNPEAIDHVATTFPKMKICLAHGGWPFVTQVVSLAVERPNVYLSPDAYIGNIAGSNDYVVAANYMLQKKVMFGTAYPIFSEADILKLWLNAGFREEVKEDVFYNNALAYFGIK